jgi:hypothetical protein
MAEGEGFEPPVRFPAQRFSRPPVSTTHTSLRVSRVNSLPAFRYRPLLGRGGPPFRLLLAKGGVTESRRSFRQHKNSRNNTQPLSLPRRPLRLDLDDSVFSVRVLPKAAPPPLIRLLHQPSPHWIAMNVSYLLDKLPLTPYVEIVITPLPGCFTQRSCMS